jgi:hypothetical protein
MLLPSVLWTTSLFQFVLLSSCSYNLNKGVEGWSPPNIFSNSFISSPPLHLQTLSFSSTSTTTRSDPKDPSLFDAKQPYPSFVGPRHRQSVVEGRRSFLNVASISACLFVGAAVVGTYPTMADAAAAPAGESSVKPGTRYISGKTPMVPGQPPQDKSNPKGTKKDPDFLRSIADCRSQCQNTPGSDGYSRAKEDCLSECQDICCRTYEQCTFNIVPRL